MPLTLLAWQLGTGEVKNMEKGPAKEIKGPTPELSFISVHTHVSIP